MITSNLTGHPGELKYTHFIKSLREFYQTKAEKLMYYILLTLRAQGPYLLTLRAQGSYLLILRAQGPYLLTLVQVTIYRSLLIGRDDHLDQSEAYDLSNLFENTGPDVDYGIVLMTLYNQHLKIKYVPNL